VLFIKKPGSLTQQISQAIAKTNNLWQNKPLYIPVYPLFRSYPVKKIVLKSVGSIAISALLLVGGFAQASEELATKNACMSCHKVDIKVVGPALKDIANKYKGDEAAAATLAAKVKTGGSGVWGPIPMPPNAHVSDADVKTLIDWILSLADK